MKKLLISAAATALLLGTAVAAPDNDNDRHNRRGEAAQTVTNGRAAERAERIRNNESNASERTNTRASKRSNDIDARGNNRSAAQERAQYRQNIRNGNVTHAERERDFNRIMNNNNTAAQRNADRRRDNARNDRHRSNFNMTQYRRNVRAERHFRIGAYRAPHGYSYRRWSYGERLPSIYFARSYWLTNFLTFGLLTPPDGYVWVRYGDDALLIDEYTGEIVQVQYGVFI